MGDESIQYDSIMENIILVGFMGTGKTAVAREISRILEFPHLETDKMIVEKEKMSIPEIFAEKGEAYFRDVEHDLICEIYKERQEKVVVCTGGGLPLQSRNREILRGCGYVVWLKTSAEETYERVKLNNERPLLQTADPLQTIKDLMAERWPIYEGVSNFQIETAGLNASELASGIVDSASYYFSQMQATQ